MISKIDIVYNNVANKYGLDEKLVKSVGSAVFSHLKDKILSLEEGSCYLSHFGSFILKSQKIENQVHKYLAMRRYKCSKDPNYVNKPISKAAKKLFSTYLNVILPFKKKKIELSERQVEFCKKQYESYEKDIN
jgi:nucleoid DNA-binding protein